VVEGQGHSVNEVHGAVCSTAYPASVFVQLNEACSVCNLARC